MQEQQLYDVALWRYFPATFPDVVEYVTATTPLAAIMQLMEASGLTRVQHAAARLAPAGPIVSYHVIKLYENGFYDQPDTSWRRQ